MVTQKGILIVIGALTAIFVGYLLVAYKDLGLNRKLEVSCEPRDIEYDTETDSITVRWYTTQKCSAKVSYSANSENLDRSVEGPQSYSHELKISDLQINSAYYLYIISDDRAYGINNLPVKVETKSR